MSLPPRKVLEHPDRILPYCSTELTSVVLFFFCFLGTSVQQVLAAIPNLGVVFVFFQLFLSLFLNGSVGVARILLAACSSS